MAAAPSIDYSAVMPDPSGPEPPDLQSLARRFLDLWQDQVAAMAENADVAQQVGRLMTALASGLGAAADGRGDARDDKRARRTGSAATTGAAAASLSSGAGGDGMARLARRLERLEARMARLEAAAGGGAAKPAKVRSRKPRS